MTPAARFIVYVIARLHEASTWRDFIIIATALGYHFTPDQANAVLVAGLLIAGGLGAAFPDRIGAPDTRSTDLEIPGLGVEVQNKKGGNDNDKKSN